MVKLGYIPQFNGYDVIPTPNFANYSANDYSLKLPNNKIYVVSPATDKIIKVVVGNSLSASEMTENGATTSTISKSWACACATNAIAGVISLS